ncbi:MAG: hypothetical protein ACRC9R_12835, partial [Enterovibrio sp.]
MQPTNTNTIASSAVFTKEQLSELLLGRVGNRVYGNLQNAVAALHNSPEQPATQGAAAAPRTEFEALLERVDAHMSLLEENDSSATAPHLPTLDEISSVRSVLANYVAVYQGKKEMERSIEQRAAQGDISQDPSFMRQLNEQRVQYRDVSNQVNLELRTAQINLSRRATSARDPAPSQASEAVARSALPSAISDLMDNSAAPSNFLPDMDHDALLLDLIVRLGNNQAMSVTNPTQQMNLFSHLYAMMNGELLGNAPKNLEELLCFLLPPVCANTKTDLAQLQLLIAAL